MMSGELSLRRSGNRLKVMGTGGTPRFDCHCRLCSGETEDVTGELTAKAC